VSAFFDTNILVYAQQAGVKADRARALIMGGGKLSVQVLNEFTAVSRREQGKDWREIGEAISDVLALVDPPLALTLNLHQAASIVASAIDGGCDVLYSEDMQHGRSIGGLSIVNPFLESAA
jgi:predicted nucleic acid-binding protein